MILEVALVVSAEEAWRVLCALPPARGAAAGYEGTAVLEDADDDALTATLRLQGASGPATVAATAAVTVLDGRLAISAALVHGPGGPPPEPGVAEEVLGHLATTLAYALAHADRAPAAWDAAVPPSPAPAGSWDAPSPPPARPTRAPIAHGAVLTPAAPPADEPDVGGHALATAGPAPVFAPAEEVTPRPADVLAPGAAPAAGDELGRWVRRGAAAAAVVAAIAAVRGRR